MAICCTVCGEWFSMWGSDRLDICPTCYAENFAGAQPPLDVYALPPPPTPRQIAAMRALHDRWQSRQAEETP